MVSDINGIVSSSFSIVIFNVNLSHSETFSLIEVEFFFTLPWVPPIIAPAGPNNTAPTNPFQ